MEKALKPQSLSPVMDFLQASSAPHRFHLLLTYHHHLETSCSETQAGARGHFYSNRMPPQASISSWPPHGAKFVHANFKSPSQSLAVSTLHKIPSSTSLLRLKVTSEMPRKNRKTNCMLSKCNRTKHTFLAQKVGTDA